MLLELSIQIHTFNVKRWLVKKSALEMIGAQKATLVTSVSIVMQDISRILTEAVVSAILKASL